MKRMASILLTLLFLAGCSQGSDRLDRAMALRAKLLSQTVRFDAAITADYGDQTYSFSVRCTSDTQGGLSFSVLSPSTIAGISGEISASGGKLTFDGEALAFALMADGQITPASAPWILMRALRSGYLTSCTASQTGWTLAVDDSYEEDALHLDVWLNEQDIPTGCDIFWQGRRLLSISLTDFIFV